MTGGNDSNSDDIDVVIPSLNCRSDLDACLRRVRAQNYAGNLHIIVIDGGSTDGTPEVAAAFGADLFVNPGQYATGLTGSRHFGEVRGASPLVWILDSDNLLVGEGVARELSRPFREDPTVQISVPELSVSEHVPSFNRWLALVEQGAILKARRNGHEFRGWYRVEDLSHGISNGSILRRKALETAGGYDSDVRLLERLRRLGLSCAAIVPNARIVHRQVASAVDYARKASRRIRRFSRMSDLQLRSYFVDFPIGSPSEEGLREGIRQSLATAPANAIRGYKVTHDRAWLWGLVYPLIVGSVVFRHPIDSWRVYRRFL